MKPINADNSPCAPQSSNCVIWQGPDIECIDLCTGDTISDVIHKLATELCTIMDTLKISNYDLSCFALATCPPKDFQELIQLLIDRLCTLEGAATTPTATSSSDCPTGCIVTIEECLVTGTETTMNLVDYVTLLGQKICDLVSEISILQAQINAIDIRVTNLENAPAPTFTMPSFTVNCDLSATVLSGTSHTLTDILEALVNDATYGYCAFRVITGSNAALIDGIAKKCILDANLALTSATSSTMAVTYAGSWITDASQVTVASAINNIWIALCDAYQYLLTYKLEGAETSTIALTATQVATGSMAYQFSAVIQDTGWHDLEGFSYQGGTVGAPQARRIGNVIHFRGDVYIPPFNLGGTAVEPMTAPDSYHSLQSVGTAIGVADGISIGAGGSSIKHAFNGGARVIPTAIMEPATNLDFDLRVGSNGLIATRRLSVGTGTTVLSAYLEVGITSTGLLYYTSLDELSADATDTATIGETSALYYLTTKYGSGDYLRKIGSGSGTNGGVHAGENLLTPDGQGLGSGTLVVGQAYYIRSFVPAIAPAVDDDFTNVGAAANATGQFFIATGTTPTSWTQGSVIEAIPMSGTNLSDNGLAALTIHCSNLRQVGGMRFCLDGTLAYIDSCTTDIPTAQVCP